MTQNKQLPYYCLCSTICVNLYLVRSESPYKLFLASDSFLLHLVFSVVIVVADIIHAINDDDDDDYDD